MFGILFPMVKQMDVKYFEIWLWLIRASAAVYARVYIGMYLYLEIAFCSCNLSLRSKYGCYVYTEAGFELHNKRKLVVYIKDSFVCLIIVELKGLFSVHTPSIQYIKTFHSVP